MTVWQVVAFFLIVAALLFVSRRYISRLWRRNMFERGGPHRAGLLLGISAELPATLLISLALVVNLFNLSIESLTFMLGFLALYVIFTFPIGYVTGRYLYQRYSEKEVQRLKQQYEPRH